MFDVIVAGSGITGTCLSSILAKNGLKVLLIELGRHPRFALGEALLPQSAIWPFIIGEYFQIPEIQHLSHADRIIDHITTACGIKHSIGFGYHQPNQELKASELHQLIPPHLPFYSESHLMREDVDAYLLEVAKQYGCTYIDETSIEGIQIEDEAIHVTTSQGHFSGRYYVDASGKGSVLAAQEGYRDMPSTAKTQSRCIFSHFEGLGPIDALIDSGHPNQSNRLHDGTFHHVFDGGWMWIIPFDNFHRSESKRASIGLMLDSERYPINEELSPEAEFRQLIDRFPSIQKHLQDAKATRPFVRTKRLQYTSHTGVGHRHFLMNSAYSFIDPLYSSGLIYGFETVFAGAIQLLKAFGKIPSAQAGDFSQAAFQGIQSLLETQQKQADEMVSTAYRCMRHFETWHAWTQYWLAQVLFHDLWLQRHCFQYFSSGDKSIFEAFLQEARPGNTAPFFEDKLKLLMGLQQILDRLEGSDLSPQLAQAQMLTLLKAQDWLPKHVYAWGEASERHVDFANPELVGKLLTWGFTDSPERIRQGLFDFELPPM